MTDDSVGCQYKISNPEQKTLVVENLQPESSYEFSVIPYTRAGTGALGAFTKVTMPDEHGEFPRIPTAPQRSLHTDKWHTRCCGLCLDQEFSNLSSLSLSLSRRKSVSQKMLHRLALHKADTSGANPPDGWPGTLLRPHSGPWGTSLALSPGIVGKSQTANISVGFGRALWPHPEKAVLALWLPAGSLLAGSLRGKLIAS